MKPARGTWVAAGTDVWEAVASLPATERCIVAGCGWYVADFWTQTCKLHHGKFQANLLNDDGVAFRYPCKECQQTRWFNRKTSTCECCRRHATPPKEDENMADEPICDTCGGVMNKRNTKASSEYGRKNKRCGKCYLKWKADQRKKRGER